VEYPEAVMVTGLRQPLIAEQLVIGISTPPAALA
jgi:hypothetical protein